MSEAEVTYVRVERNIPPDGLHLMVRTQQDGSGGVLVRTTREFIQRLSLPASGETIATALESLAAELRAVTTT